MKISTKINAEMSYISEYQIQPPFGIFFTKKSQILQILQLAIYQLICNMYD